MIVKVLVENNAVSSDFQTEHGLSLYIETGKQRILFDMGKSDLFLKNAKKLQADIAAVDFAVLSHGHYDHGGGMAAFLENNGKAKVYTHQRAFEKHFARRPEGELADIGIDPGLLESGRIVLTPDRFQISEGIELFSGVTERDLFSSSNRVLLMEEGAGAAEDSFAHEQNLVIREGERLYLFAGCSHNGIVNIVRRFIRLYGRPADFVFGGFHLHNPTTKQSEPEAHIQKVGAFLKDTSSKYYTGHCTGMEPYRMLKDILQDKLEYLATGSVIEIHP